MKFKFLNHYAIWCFVASMAILASCSPGRQVLKAPLKEEGSSFLIQKMKENELKYTWFSAKFSAEYKQKGKTTSFGGQIRVRKDSVIWISLTPMLGIEAIRVVITQDSVKMINRLNDTYYSGDYNYINRFLGTNIDFDLLQAFLLGHDLQYYENERFKAGIDQGQYKIWTGDRQKQKKFVKNSDDKLKIFAQNIWLDPENFKITRADVKETGKENIRLESNYGSFEDVDGQLFPYKMEYNIRASGTIRVKADFSRVTINTPQQFPFKIPGEFTPLR